MGLGNGDVINICELWSGALSERSGAEHSDCSRPHIHQESLWSLCVGPFVPLKNTLINRQL